ncbi:ATP-binding cassette, subfamily C [Austwickia chelonae]|uniref:Putative ABC transporter permease/ATP-binding protein n=1 Tax=Austwickia chelonae NBRC 105200 TaxID=1184607 RepID=K6VP47_9MICO|nr:ABC transporter ATP-binding protein [Austwickia chelonae]GAB78479.1 putative ABC transporter permease/ATP-binding protein [Austwickia chelonae NBRC 105200]SEW39974.1 ATP-binding cassette, subfamily C [Austwickia chelonae]
MTAPTSTVDASAPETFALASGREVWAETCRLGRPQAWRVALAVPLLLFAAFCGLALPAVLGGLVDIVRGREVPLLGSGSDAVVRSIAVMVAATLAGAAAHGVGTVLSAGAADRVVADLREQSMRAALRRPLARVERAGSGDIVSRTTDDVAAVTSAVNQAVPALTGAGAAVLVTAVGMAGIHWSFVVALVVVTSPVYVFVVRRYRREAPPLYVEERAARASRAGEVLGIAEGAPTLRALQLQDYRRPRASQPSWQVTRLTVLVQVATTRLFAGVNLAEFLGVSVLLAVGAWLVQVGEVSVGQATAASLFFFRLFGPIGALVMVIDQVQSASVSLRRIVGLGTDESTDGAAAQGAVVPCSGDLTAQALTFAYDGGARVLDSFDLTVPQGSSLALVGASGAGKSTVAALFTGVRSPQGGQVLLGGVDVASMPPRVRARSLVLIAQESHVFSGSLRDDLCLAVPGADEAAVQAAVEVAGLSEWVASLPDGVDTVIGGGGVPVSPVRAQQIAIARVALLDPPVVVLDEAASEESSEPGAGVDEAAMRLAAGRTSVVVAHRLEQARLADRIVVMDSGAVVESGSHEELLAADGRYAQLWRAGRCES